MKALAVTLCCAAGAQGAFEPTSNYEVRTIEGWKVRVNRRLLREENALGERALKLLAADLFGVARKVPEKALAKIRKVPIWLEARNERVVGACYHPSRRWLEENDFNPEKAKSVEIGNATNYLDWTSHQPMMVLHELAHAYHHQVLGYEHPGIKEAYARAVEGKSYESVLRYDGNRARAYALNNDQEYFAELTESYFGTNDFYPFVRPEVKEHDPETFELLGKLWKE